MWESPRGWCYMSEPVGLKKRKRKQVLGVDPGSVVKLWPDGPETLRGATPELCESHSYFSPMLQRDWGPAPVRAPKLTQAEEFFPELEDIIYDGRFSEELTVAEREAVIDLGMSMREFDELVVESVYE